MDMNSLKKLSDEIPDDMKETLKKEAMEKLGLSNSESGKSAEQSSAPSEEVQQTQSDGTSEVPVNDSEQAESTDEDKSNARGVILRICSTEVRVSRLTSDPYQPDPVRPQNPALHHQRPNFTSHSQRVSEGRR